MFAHAAFPSFAQRPRQRRVAQQSNDGVGAFPLVIDENSARAIGHLKRDPAGPTGHHRCSLPQGLRYAQSEALADRLLNHDVRQGLKGIDLDVPDADDVREYVDQRIALCLGSNLPVDIPPLGVVERQGAHQRELKVRHLSPCQSVGRDHAQGSFHGSNRDTCVTRGRSKRIPVHSSTWRAVRSSR